MSVSSDSHCDNTQSISTNAVAVCSGSSNVVRMSTFVGLGKLPGPTSVDVHDTRIT